jgi:hypothetical protein
MFLHLPVTLELFFPNLFKRMFFTNLEFGVLTNVRLLPGAQEISLQPIHVVDFIRLIIKNNFDF